MTNFAFRLEQIRCLCLAVLLITLLPAAAQAKTDLIFVVDGSGSISSSDWDLQKDGIISALQDPLFVPRDGTVAIAVIQFAASGPRTRVEVSYRIVSSEAGAQAIIAGVAGMVQLRGGTNPGDGINAATVHLGPNARTDASQSYCLSTDGNRNSGASQSSAIATAKASAFGLDSFSVIAIEDPPFFFESDALSQFGGLVFGGGAVFVVQNTVEFANTVGALCFPNEADLVGLEVTQAVQDLENSVALVKNKATLVRAYIQSKGTDPESVRARLRGRRGGAELPGSPLTAINAGGSVSARPDALDRRNVFNDSLNFRLPVSWTSGSIELEVEPVGTALECKEVAGPTADDCKTTVTFQTGSEFEVKLVKVKYESGGSNIEPSTADLNELERRLLAIFPTSKIDRTTGSLDMGSGTPDAEDVNSRLELMRFLDFCFSIFGCDRLYYGAVDQNGQLRYGTGFTGGLANDIPGTVSSGVIRDGNSYGRNRHAHEIGHTMGRHHAVNAVSGSGTFKVGVCGEGADLTAPNFPFIEMISGILNATIGPLSSGDNKIVFGWDSRRNQVIDPTQRFELMSYCGNARWISSFTYEGIRQFINSNFPVATAASAAVSPVAYRVFRATIDLNANTANLSPTASLMSDRVPPSPPPGAFEMVFRDAAGAEVKRISFAPIRLQQDIEEGGTPSTANRAIVLMPIEDDPTIVGVEIIESGAVIGSLSASANPPMVTVVFPNGGESLSGSTVALNWSASDPDGDPLTYSVQFSADGGTIWDTLVVDHPDTTLEVSLTNLGETTTGLIRVQASDGFNTAEDTSDGTFVTPNSPPGVEIVTPVNSDIFSGVQSILFEVFARDTEDGTLADSNVLWTSNLDGTLGTGNSLSRLASDLREGEHLITVIGTDSKGASDSDQVTISVFRIAPPQNLPPSALCRDATVSANAVCEADANIDNGSFDPDGDPITLTQSPAQPYPLGSTVVTLTVSDGSAQASCQATVTVVDDTPPTISVITAINQLWPPNHMMVDVGFDSTTTDNCDIGPEVSVAVSSDEPTASDLGAGGSKHAPDAEIIIGGGVLIRAERSGNSDGRVYEITATATDESGNSAASSTTVKVNHKINIEAVDSGQIYDATTTN